MTSIVNKSHLLYVRCWCLCLYFIYEDRKEAAIRFIYFNLLEVVLFNFYKIEEDKQKQTL